MHHVCSRRRTRSGMDACATSRNIANDVASRRRRGRKGWSRTCAQGAHVEASQEGRARPKAVVIGAGWAGFGAARALARAGAHVELLDAAAAPGGVSAGWRTKEGRPVEAGMKGFWTQYPNIDALAEEIGAADMLTECTRSTFYAPGRVVVDAPILGELKPRLPTPLGQLLQTSPRFRTLPWTDQLSMAPLMLAAIDVGAERERYDNMSAEELFRICGVTKRLHDEFLKPLLLVGLFAPPEEVSAAAMLETFYFYALAHQNDFDVRWCRTTVADAFFAPMVRDIEADGGQVLARKFVRDVKSVGNQVKTVVAQDEEGNQVEYQADAVVFAVGISGMKKILQTSRTLGSRSEFNGVMNLKSIDCVATRLWFDRIVPTKTPSNVISGFYDDIGGTFFHLNDIQDEFKNAGGSVIAADFYHANALLPMTDEEIVAEVKSNLAACIPGYADANVIDYAVLRFPQAVTHFSPGSERHRMTQTTSFDNVFVAGDWVKELDHGSNGLSQERAYVTGLSAANLAMSKLGLSKKAEILQVEPDEAHIAAAKQLNRSLHNILDATGIPQLFL